MSVSIQNLKDQFWYKEVYPLTLRGFTPSLLYEKLDGNTGTHTTVSFV